MSLTGGALLILGVLGSTQEGAGDDAVAAALRLADQGHLAQAWQALEDERDPVRRNRTRATLFLQAGDFSAELAAAEEGLTHAPADQELLYFAAQAALWLRDDERGEAYLDRLERSLARQPPADPAAWQALVEQFRATADDLEQSRREREATVALSRRVSLGLLGATLAGLLVLSLRAGPRVRYETPAP